MEITVLATSNGSVTVSVHPAADVVSGTWNYDAPPVVGFGYSVEFECEELKWGLSAALAKEAPREQGNILARVEERQDDGTVTLRVGSGIWEVDLKGMPDSAIGQKVVVKPAGLIVYAHDRYDPANNRDLPPGPTPRHG